MIIPIKAKWFVVIMAGIEFVSSFGTPGSGVSHVAHLGGMLFGYLYLRGLRLPKSLCPAALRRVAAGPITPQIRSLHAQERKKR